MNDMPTVKVDFENMKHSMLTAINNHLDEISKVAESQLESLLSDKNFLDQVRNQIEFTAKHTISKSVNQAIEQEIEKHIKDIVSERYKKLWEDLYPVEDTQDEN